MSPMAVALTHSVSSHPPCISSIHRYSNTQTKTAAEEIDLWHRILGHCDVFTFVSMANPARSPTFRPISPPQVSESPFRPLVRMTHTGTFSAVPHYILLQRCYLSVRNLSLITKGNGPTATESQHQRFAMSYIHSQRLTQLLASSIPNYAPTGLMSSTI